MKPLFPDEIRMEQDKLKWEADYWYSYVYAGLHNQIQDHSRKDQRLYQRKYCSYLSRLHRFRDEYPEYFI